MIVLVYLFYVWLSLRVVDFIAMFVVFTDSELIELWSTHRYTKADSALHLVYSLLIAMAIYWDLAT
jgi:hypothetical protein